MASNNSANEAKLNRFERIRWNFSAKSIVWLDPNIHHYDPEYNYLNKQLHNIANNVTLFQQISECMQYLQVLYEEKIIAQVGKRRVKRLVCRLVMTAVPD